MILDFHSKLLWITSVMILCTSLVLLFKSSDKSAKIFGIFSLTVMIWSTLYGFYIATSSSLVALIIIRINHALGIIASLGFIIFSYSYTKSKITTAIFTLILSIISILSSSIIFTKSFIIDVFEISEPNKWGWVTGNFYILYIMLFLTCWIITLSKIYNNYNKISGNDKINHKFMFWGLTLGIIPPFLLNILLPYFNIYYISWTGPIFSSIWIFVIGYSIMSYQQMNVRLVIIEIIAIAMSAMLFINIFIQAEIGRVENIILFITFVTLSVTLIRTVISEVKGKQMLKALNDTLEQKVREQTAEIRSALENETEARQELEKLNTTKNQFVLITQHGIRGPIQNISESTKSIISTLPKTKQKLLKSEIDGLKTSLLRLEKINDDFVNVADSNTNDKILNLEETDILNIIESIVDEMAIAIKKKKIEVTINRNEKDWIRCNIDKNKIYNALLIIIENSIKYNIRAGKIIIDSKIENNHQKIEIIDTGIGISREELTKVNSNHFYRSTEAKEINPFGMGIGFSVAKAIIEAHRGKIEIYSMGQNQGSTVKIYLPVNYLSLNI